MARFYAANWSAKTRGARWRTVTGTGVVTASSMHTAVQRAVKLGETQSGYKFQALTLHIEATAIVPKKERPA